MAGYLTSSGCLPVHMHSYAMGMDLGLSSLGGGRGGKSQGYEEETFGENPTLLQNHPLCTHILLLDRAVQINFVSDFFFLS